MRAQKHDVRGVGAQGWTMVADCDVHPDRPIGRCPIGLGYEVRS